MVAYVPVPSLDCRVTTTPHTSSVTDPNINLVHNQGNRYSGTVVASRSRLLRVQAIEGVEETDPNNQDIRSLSGVGVRSDLEHLPNC